MIEGLTAWHERNPLLDAFCESLDDPNPRSAARLGNLAFGVEVPSENGHAASSANQEDEVLRGH